MDIFATSPLPLIAALAMVGGSSIFVGLFLELAFGSRRNVKAKSVGAMVAVVVAIGGLVLGSVV